MELRIEEVRKCFGTKIAVNDVSIILTPGIYGLLGSNGAGKSTLINLLTNNIARDYGSILWNGEEILTLKGYCNDLGYMPQTQGYYKYMSAEEFLIYIARLKGLKKKQAKIKSEELLDALNLLDVRKQQIGTFSGGMKQRIMLAQALLNDPKILILDEPTAGVDPEERINIRNYISNIASNRIVIIATHIVSDVEAIAKNVILMNSGKISVEGNPSELIEKINPFVYEIAVTSEMLSSISNKYIVSNLRYTKDGLVAKIIAKEKPDEIIVNKDVANLEDVYLYYSNECNK